MPRLGAKRGKRGKQPDTSWRDSPEGVAQYRRVRAEAQKLANELGFDYGMYVSDATRHWMHRMLPMKHHRFGSETSCEVVMCEIQEKCQPGHGSRATRPPSVTGPDYHGGPWCGREKALELNREFDREFQKECALRTGKGKE